MRTWWSRWITAGILSCLLGSLAGAGETWQNITHEAEPGLPGDEIQFLQLGEDGQVWIGTLSGLGVYKAGAFKTVLPAVQAWDVLERDGITFVGHANGVTILTAGGKKEGLEGHTVAPLVPVKSGLVWAIAKNLTTEQNHLFAYDGEAWTEVEAYKDRRVVDLVRTRTGSLWLTVDGDGVLEVDPKGTIEEPKRHLQGLNVTAVYEDGDGQVWCGLWGRGLAVWDGATWTRHLTKQKESAILAICQDGEGSLWVATSANGAFRKGRNEDGWQNLLADEGAINTLAATRDGRVYVSSQMRGGLRTWNGEAFVVSLDSPLPIRCVLQVPGGPTLAGGVLDGLHIRKKK